MAALINLSLQHIEPDLPWLEFGVACGATLRQLAEHAPFIYGFDWFKGLPEDWRDYNGNLQDPKGKFACSVPQDLPENVQLVIGRFEDTLPEFIHMEHVALAPMLPRFGFVHIDCDLYSSTKFVLDQLEPYLDGTVIAFDEIRGFPAGECHEGKAWCEFLLKGTYAARLIGHQHNAGAIYKLSRR